MATVPVAVAAPAHYGAGTGVAAVIAPQAGSGYGDALGRRERLLRLRPSYARMVEEITALHAHPELRPIEQSPPRSQDRPLGPALVLLVGLVVISLLIT
ncbi:hypothetical protein [Streptomyces sp. NPDC002758]